GSFLQDVRSTRQLPAPVRALRRLKIKELQARAADRSDPEEADAAQRLLENVFVFTSHYEPIRYLKRGDPARALLLLQIAHAIKPDHPQVCYNRARAHAMNKQKRKAIRDLACALRSGRLPAGLLEKDAYLKPLRQEKAFRELMEGPSQTAR
ncbi:MAG: hypothetical protein ACE5ID_10550, partial [Acidobacteriota bacterium]